MTNTAPSVRRLALLGAVIGWLAIILQFALTLQNSIANGNGIGHGLLVFFGFFTITTNIFVALVLTAHAGFAGKLWQFFRRPGVTTCACVSMTIVGVTYYLLLSHLWNPTGLQLIVDRLLHYVMPTLFLLFWWMAVPGDAITWLEIPGWLIYPAAYIAYFFVRGAILGLYPYYFIDPSKLGYPAALRNVAAVALVAVVLSALLVLVNHLRPASRLATS